MAEERNTHVKVAMADAMGCLLIAYIAFMVGMVGLKQIPLDAAAASLSLWVGVGLLLVTVIAYLNENLLATAIFGPAAVFFVAFPAFALTAAASATAMAIIFLGIVLILDGVVSLKQPVMLLPILLFLAGIAFLVLGVWWNSGGDTLMMVFGALFTLVALVALYLGTAIVFMVVGGKPVLPLFIRSSAASG